MKNDIINYMSSGLCWILTAIQVDEALKYVNLGLSILVTLFSVAMTLYSLYAKIRAKGKVEKKDIESAKADLEKIKEELEGFLKEKKDDNR